MSKWVWWVAVGVGALLSACSGSDQAEDAAADAVNSAGTTSVAGSAGTAGTAPSFPACATSAGGSMPAMVGLYEAIDATGVVTAVNDDLVEIEVGDGTIASSLLAMHWRGPSLIDVLPVGTRVALSVQVTEALGGPLSWTIVHSPSALVATVFQNSFGAQSKATGATTVLDTPAGFPSMAYTNKGCCSLESERVVSCDYSDLTASIDGNSVSIGYPESERAGSWAVTNLGAEYSDYGVEGGWSLSATFVGPATDENNL